MFANLTFALPTFQLITSILTIFPSNTQPDLGGLLLSSHRTPRQLSSSLDLFQTSIEELGLYLSNGSVTSVDLVAAYLANIERNNYQGLKLRAVIQTAPYEGVLDIAAKLDVERELGHNRGPLHGIPILVKGNIATDPELGMDTSAGNFALKESKVKQDALVVRKLRAAGAIIIGKANLSELSHWKAYSKPGKPELGEGITNGWSAVGGQTSSAYVVGGFEAGGDPSSSSAGSAVGVSAGFAAAALGTDTIGSVIDPAGRAALFGIRPSTGLISTSGVVPITADMDTVGPMGFTSRDVAIMLDALMDNTGRYLNSISILPRISLKLGLVRKNFLDEGDGRFIEPETCIKDVESALKSTMAALSKDLGAEIVDVDMGLNFKDFLEFEEIAFNLLTMGMSEDMDLYLADLAESPVRNLKDLVMWNDAHSDIEFPPGECCQQRLIESLISPGRSSPEYSQAWDELNHLGRDRGLGYLFERHQVDALVFSPDLGSPMTMIAAMGYAAGIAPMGYCENDAPFGILFVVKPQEEEKLLNIMALYESVMPRRRTPAQLTERG